MKIAGRKNDGAWYRANRMILNLGTAEKAALLDIISGLPSAADAFQTIQDLSTYGGLDSTGDAPDSLDTWADQLSTYGIPRQVWMGVLSWDTYTRGVAGDGSPVYRPDHAAAMRTFATDLRAAVKRFTLARRQVIDLSNLFTREQGNVGGRADAVKGN